MSIVVTGKFFYTENDIGVVLPYIFFQADNDKLFYTDVMLSSKCTIQSHYNGVFNLGLFDSIILLLFFRIVT